MLWATVLPSALRDQPPHVVSAGSCRSSLFLLVVAEHRELNKARGHGFTVFMAKRTTVALLSSL